MKQFIKTSERIEVKNYPYGFRLKTTLTDYIEFDFKKGYRHCTQTIDPRNGRINKPKKSTYSPLIVRYFDEIGHIKSLHFHFNGDKEINQGCNFIAENFDLFTPEEIKYLYSFIFSMALVDFKATCIYGGSDPEALKPLYNSFFDTCKQGIKEGGNLFNNMQLNTEAIEATKPEGFSPFKVTSYGI